MRIDVIDKEMGCRQQRNAANEIFALVPLPFPTQASPSSLAHSLTHSLSLTRSLSRVRKQIMAYPGRRLSKHTQSPGFVYTPIFSL
ncbi:hypothetical protein TRIATDRAFT_298411 [Trichoderma atroviride IMI 206040]|uniref:Uncharacterized protein n=1 Tax=Hypocrea atroviridis (strain ATCC 20476 / IMI 206040) TaxID=452589 RepID=G9NMX4_HYPAI|nr:uncharacterized protein TRIATDRAFT_298411 [Trichoderma atroviride IMI 206040]EHK48254.1 hypothetical protein TRIATDRAFT_298411 [Trichoderma atroviride IMI 206040]